MDHHLSQNRDRRVRGYLEELHSTCISPARREFLMKLAAAAFAAGATEIPLWARQLPPRFPIRIGGPPSNPDVIPTDPGGGGPYTPPGGQTPLTNADMKLEGFYVMPSGTGLGGVGGSGQQEWYAYRTVDMGGGDIRQRIFCVGNGGWNGDLVELEFPSTPPNTTIASAPALILIKNHGPVWRGQDAAGTQLYPAMNFTSAVTTGNFGFMWDPDLHGLWMSWELDYTGEEVANHHPDTGFIPFSGGPTTSLITAGAPIGPWGANVIPKLQSQGWSLIPTSKRTYFGNSKYAKYMWPQSGVAASPHGTNWQPITLVDPFTAPVDQKWDISQVRSLVVKSLMLHDESHPMATNILQRACNHPPEPFSALNPQEIPGQSGSEPLGLSEKSIASYICRFTSYSDWVRGVGGTNNNRGKGKDASGNFVDAYFWGRNGVPLNHTWATNNPGHAELNQIRTCIWIETPNKRGLLTLGWLAGLPPGDPEIATILASGSDPDGYPHTAYSDWSHATTKEDNAPTSQSFGYVNTSCCHLQAMNPDSPPGGTGLGAHRRTTTGWIHDTVDLITASIEGNAKHPPYSFTPVDNEFYAKNTIFPGLREWQAGPRGHTGSNAYFNETTKRLMIPWHRQASSNTRVVIAVYSIP